MAIGAAAFVSSWCRLTYSIVLIILEIAGSLDLFLPLMIAVAISNSVSMIFNRGLFQYGLRGKQLPFLRNHIPHDKREIRIREVVKDLVCDVVESVCSVRRLSEVMRASYNTLPVVNSSGNLIGMIPKNFLHVILENHHFYEFDGYDVEKINATYVTAKKRVEGESAFFVDPSLLRSVENA